MKGKVVKTRSPEGEHFARVAPKPKSKTGQKANRARARAARNRRKGS